MLLSPLSVGAAGFGVGPAQLEITAESGGEYQEMMFIRYINDSNCIVKLSATGEISDWFSFYDPNTPTVPIERITASPGEWTYITVKINIPPDAPMDTVMGTIHAQIVSGEDESKSAISLQGKVDVTIEIVEVTEEEVVAEGEEVTVEGEEVVAEGEEVADEGEEVAAEGEEAAAEGEDVAAGPINSGLIIGIVVFVVLVAGIGGFVYSRKRTQG
jgi:hypothetical protein